MFPETPATLLKKISEFAAEDVAAEWTQFVELYDLPLHLFVKSLSSNMPSDELDDVVQEVFLRLVDFLRTGSYDRTKGRLRDYLAVTARRLVIDRFRAHTVRPTTLATVAVEDVAENLVSTTFATSDPGELLDAKWRVAVRQAATRYVFTHMALSDQTKAVYQALESGRSVAELAAEMNLSRDAVKQIKSRVSRAIEAVVARMEEHG